MFMDDRVLNLMSRVNGGASPRHAASITAVGIYWVNKFRDSWRSYTERPPGVAAPFNESKQRASRG